MDEPSGERRRARMRFRVRARMRARLHTRLRPPGFDDLGLKRALSDRLLPVLVAAMAFLAALALSGYVAAAALDRHWREGAEAAVMVQVPQPEAPAPAALLQTARPDPNATRQTRRDRVLAVLHTAPGVAAARALSADELAALLKPWLGSELGGISLPMPAVVDVRLGDPPPEMTSLAAQIDAAAPGAMLESHGPWVRRLTVLARSLQACTGVALLVVTGVAAAVVGVATRAGLAARRETIEIVHGLGATDGYIAGRFAWRAMTLAAIGGAAGAAAALPVLIWLADLAAPFAGLQEGAFSDSARYDALFASLPDPLWAAMPLLPAGAAMIGWLTAQGTVRRWLRRLP